jgi:hypothetical protein
VELLRDRRYEQWRLDESRRESATVDELVIMRQGARWPSAGTQS